MRALTITDGAIELPLWERTTTPERPGPWRTVTSDRLADLADESIVLRGLPMTGLLRRHACDLFVHGTGGGASEAGADARAQTGYDRVTERWFESWLGATTQGEADRKAEKKAKKLKKAAKLAAKEAKKAAKKAAS